MFEEFLIQPAAAIYFSGWYKCAMQLSVKTIVKITFELLVCKLAGFNAQ